MTAIQPVISGFHKLRVSGYSFDWDGSEIIPTERNGALGWGVFARGEHYGTVDLPPNKPAEREITAWLTRGGMMHGTDDHLRLIAASCENFRDYAHGKNNNVLGPMSFAPGVAVEWVEIEGPLDDMWPPASHRALFDDLEVKEWSEDVGAAKPKQQTWPRGNPHSFPKDIYGEHGQHRPAVYVESKSPAEDADRLLRRFLPRALRRPVEDAEVAEYTDMVQAKLAAGAAFRDAMLAAYRAVICADQILLIRNIVSLLWWRTSVSLLKTMNLPCTILVTLIAAQPLPAEGLPEGNNGIAARYPGDTGIENDPAVILADDFEKHTNKADVGSIWNSVYNQTSLTREKENVFLGNQANEFSVPEDRIVASGAARYILDDEQKQDAVFCVTIQNSPRLTMYSAALTTAAGFPLASTTTGPGLSVRQLYYQTPTSRAKTPVCERDTVGG